MTFLKLLGAIHSADRNVAVEGVRHALMERARYASAGGIVVLGELCIRESIRVSVFAAASIATGTPIPGTPIGVYGLASDSARYASRVDRIGVHRVIELSIALLHHDFGEHNEGC